MAASSTTSPARTGSKRQARVHARSLAHQIAGDRVYRAPADIILVKEDIAGGKVDAPGRCHSSRLPTVGGQASNSAIGWAQRHRVARILHSIASLDPIPDSVTHARKAGLVPMLFCLLSPAQVLRIGRTGAGFLFQRGEHRLGRNTKHRYAGPGKKSECRAMRSWSFAGALYADHQYAG